MILDLIDLLSNVTKYITVSFTAVVAFKKIYTMSSDNL